EFEIVFSVFSHKNAPNKCLTFWGHFSFARLSFSNLDIRFLTSIDKKSAYCLLNGSESGSFGLRSSNQLSKENKAKA
ncbi:hypothetical protein, partial [uncultured Algoriphagus sp.]|uniref:hypothetical protein n=1 Tax=uncultured Algoriphagus sp. TaxID=417365 RepID=UPI002598816D